MTFKEFNHWCSDRACDGCWGLTEAMFCCGVCETLLAIPFWKREKHWKTCDIRPMAEQIVKNTNEIIEKTKQDTVF